jgi:hypothetical protein
MNMNMALRYYPLVLLLIGLALPAITNSQPVINVFPDESPPGAVVEVFGCGFTEYSSITIYIDAIIVGNATTDSRGCFWTPIVIPDVTPGYRTITAKDSAGSIAYTSFLVTKPSITVSPTEGPGGTIVKISGIGLGPYQVYTLKFDELVLVPLLFTNDKGELPDLTVQVPGSVFTGIHNFTLIYTGYYREVKGIRQIYYAPSTSIMAYATFNVTWGAATLSDIIALNETLITLKASLDVLIQNITSLTIELAKLKNSTDYSIVTLNTKLQALNETLQDLSILLSQALKEIEANYTALSSSLDAKTGELSSKLNSLREYVDGLRVEFKSDLQRESSRVNNLASTMEFMRVITIVSIAISVIAVIIAAQLYLAFRKLKPEFHVT